MFKEAGKAFLNSDNFNFRLGDRGGGGGGSWRVKGGLKKDVFVRRYLWMPPNEKMVTDSQGSFA